VKKEPAAVAEFDRSVGGDGLAAGNVRELHCDLNAVGMFVLGSPEVLEVLENATRRAETARFGSERADGRKNAMK
jgi:hypothetical protein